ncbi:DUF488 family protein [Gluconacetobacter sacchari]|uniref:DUF488 domain-containing protein n=1 Tax=Gluconacetobacter sacchari TaxID=92759 RepID=UPI0039B5F545
MGKKSTTLATIGYESADLDDFLATLARCGVTRVIDIREIAISRRRGFAKSALSSALLNSGIDYVHLRGLGDPKEGRLAARSGDYFRFERVFHQHMKTDAAQRDLRTAAILAAEGGACLLCFERDHRTCHRTIVAQALSKIVPLTIRNLGVSAGLAKQCQSERQLAFA